MKSHVERWAAEIQTLGEVAETEPYASYMAFIFGINHGWNFLMRTVPNIEHLFVPLETTIKRKMRDSGLSNFEPLDLKK